MLGADVIGFHTRRYRGHFTAALRRLLGLEMDADGHVRYQGRAIALGVLPMGIDASGFADRAASRAVSAPATPRVALLVGTSLQAQARWEILEATLSLLGYPVASLVAGLGLGGLALALAAQKTAENVFGAFSIGIVS